MFKIFHQLNCNWKFWLSSQSVCPIRECDNWQRKSKRPQALEILIRFDFFVPLKLSAFKCDVSLRLTTSKMMQRHFGRKLKTKTFFRNILQLALLLEDANDPCRRSKYLNSEPVWSSRVCLINRSCFDCMNNLERLAI